MSNRGDKRPAGNGSFSPSHVPPKKPSRPSNTRKESDGTKIGNAKIIMECIKDKLSATLDSHSETLMEYIRENISKLDSIKAKTTVGVFGKTGAGKSSLINAVLEEKDLLPSGTLCACTSVIIQVVANTADSNYQAEIEFISKEEWRDELEMNLNILREDGEKKESAVIKSAKEKITALYGKGPSLILEDLMKDENFSGIPEFLKSETKNFTCDNASELSEEIGCYIQHDTSSPGGCYWPVVKSVTLKVPNRKELLEHVVLMDLPGTGDYNNSRDTMWISKLRDCSTVWIVSEINRALSEKDAWQFLHDSVNDMTEGGECCSISFICTKTDVISTHNYMRSSKLKNEDLHIRPEDPQLNNKRKSACILHRNETAKKSLKEDFLQDEIIKKHFGDDDFLTVFTVSSEEFTSDNPILNPEQTEIPDLQNLLRKYNNSHTNERVHHYISGARGITSLIEGLKTSDAKMMEEKSRLYTNLEREIHCANDNLHKYCDEIESSLEALLSDGATESEVACSGTAKDEMEKIPHQTMTPLCKNNGFFRSKKGQYDLNKSLAKPMIEHLNTQFSEFFPVLENVPEKSLQAKINQFTLIRNDLLKKYEGSPAVSHMLKFLKAQEMKLKKNVQKEIVEQKKKIYAALSEAVKTKMKPGYANAAAIKGRGSTKIKHDILLQHIESSKSEMFQEAKKHMLKLLHNTMHSTVEKLRIELMKAVELSLRNENTLPYIDISEEIEELNKLSSQRRV